MIDPEFAVHIQTYFTADVEAYLYNKFAYFTIFHGRNVLLALIKIYLLFLCRPLGPLFLVRNMIIIKPILSHDYCRYEIEML